MLMMCTIYKQQFKTGSYFDKPISIRSGIISEKEIDKLVTVG